MKGKKYSNTVMATPRKVESDVVLCYLFAEKRVSATWEQFIADGSSIAIQTVSVGEEISHQEGERYL